MVTRRGTGVGGQALLAGSGYVRTRWGWKRAAPLSGSPGRGGAAARRGSQRASCHGDRRQLPAPLGRRASQPTSARTVMTHGRGVGGGQGDPSLPSSESPAENQALNSPPPPCKTHWADISQGPPGILEAPGRSAAQGWSLRGLQADEDMLTVQDALCGSTEGGRPGPPCRHPKSASSREHQQGEQRDRLGVHGLLGSEPWGNPE